ncbi:uncharacterized protein CBL_00397 [Carabus blaptoides fortunei]
MGAKYLNEIDLGSREECLRLCCETDTCDVFVYEEKSPGSCYLFHCGPPEDFKCKFTRHANYSSAVLTVNRHLNELENQIKLTKHEQELNRLRKIEEDRQPESLPRAPVTRITPSPTPSTTTQKLKLMKEILPIIEVTKPSPVIGRHCSRYQFECRTSGECIAIYNACDGIPQCADGSDEAPELGCPELATTTAPSPPPPPLPVNHNNPYEQNNQLRKALPPLIMDNPYQQPAPVQSNPRISPPIDISHDTAQFLRPVSDVRGQSAGAPPGYNESPNVQSQSQQAFIPPRPSSTNNWIPHDTNQMPVLPPNSPYGDKNSHIFNHKETGLQVLDTPDSATGGQYGDMNVRNDYPKLPNYYGDMYRQQYQVSENWQPNRPQINGDINPYTNNDNWQPVQIPQIQPVNDQPNQMYQSNVDVKSNGKADLINKQAEVKTYDHTIIHEPIVQHEEKIVIHKEPVHEHEQIKKVVVVEEQVQTSITNNNINTKNKSYSKKDHAHAHVSTAEELKQNVEELLDGESERPGGAVLSLSLGLVLTCVMAILLGCRLRVVRRRMRRGGKSPYAHDADYLVNGMYL